VKHWKIWLFLVSCAWFYVTGEHEEKLTRPVMLITDINQLIAQENAEYSHTQVLVIHEQFGKKELNAVLSHRELSYGIQVAFSAKRFTRPVKESKSGISGQLKGLTDRNLVTLREFLISQYEEKTRIKMPIIGKKEFCLYEGGKKRESFQ